MKYVPFSSYYPNALWLIIDSVVKEINSINTKELELGLTASWHDDYKDSARIFVGGLHKDLTEGDVITIFSQ
jgi:RNA-binding motif X-linked protein 2